MVGSTAQHQPSPAAHLPSIHHLINSHHQLTPLSQRHLCDKSTQHRPNAPLLAASQTPRNSMLGRGKATGKSSKQPDGHHSMFGTGVHGMGTCAPLRPLPKYTVRGRQQESKPLQHQSWVQRCRTGPGRPCSPCHRVSPQPGHRSPGQ